MRVAFIDPFPENSTNSWVQTVQHLKSGLSNNGIDVIVIDEFKLRPSLAQRVWQSVHWLRGKKYLFDREPDVLKSMSEKIRQYIEFASVNLVFCPSSLPVAYLEVSCPIVFWTDATFGAVIDLYEPFSNLCRRTTHYGHLAERLAMLNAERSIFSSNWASEHASSSYRIPESKIATIPLGANLTDIPARAEVLSNIENKIRQSFRLVFVGYDWDRKGGQHAVEVHKILREKGIESTLTIIGCNPKLSGDTSNIDVLGKLDKSDPDQYNQFKEIMLHSHFLILPSQADCTAIVFSEAAAYGLPVISTNVGGHRSIIQHGRTGYLFEPDDPAPLMADQIQMLDNEKPVYRELAIHSRKTFEESLSWDAGITSLIDLFHQVVGETGMLKNAG